MMSFVRRDGGVKEGGMKDGMKEGTVKVGCPTETVGSGEEKGRIGQLMGKFEFKKGTGNGTGERKFMKEFSTPRIPKEDALSRLGCLTSLSCPIRKTIPKLVPEKSSDTRPLTPYEEQWLSTISNWCTMTLFKPIENYKTAVSHSKNIGRPQPHYLFEGLQKSVINKTIDDCIFMSNIRRLNSGIETHLDIKNPSGDNRGRATVGVLARVATLMATYPLFQLQDRRGAIRREVLGVEYMRKISKGGVVPSMGSPRLSIAPPQSLYRGFVRQTLKESVFTATYVLSSGTFGSLLQKKRLAIYENLTAKCPALRADEATAARATDMTIVAGKAACAGALATVVTQPFDFVGRPLPSGGMATVMGRAAKKTVKKASYNFVNSIILQNLQTTKCHRRFIAALIPPTEGAGTAAGTGASTEGASADDKAAKDLVMSVNDLAKAAAKPLKNPKN